MKPLTIWMLTNTYAPILGGLERSIQSFSSELRRRGHRVLTIAPAYEGAPERETHVIRLPALQRFSGTDFSLSLPVPALLSEAVKRLRPDVLHSHHPFLMGDLALRLAAQHQIPLVYTYHTLFEEYHNFPIEYEPANRFVVELATGYANLCDHVIAPSQSVRDMLRDKGVERPVTVVPTGVNPSFFAAARGGSGSAVRKRLGLPKNAFVVGHIGRLSPEKNLEFLAAAAARFLKREPHAHFLLVGKGPSEEAIQKVFAAAGVSDRVHAPGVLKGAELIGAYRAMDVFAFASKSETQGMVVTEAMACGAPVVAIDAPGVREVVRDRQNGRLLAVQSVNAFSEALRWMAQADAPRREQMRAAALKTARKFSVEICAARAAAVYRRVRKRRAALSNAEATPWRGVMERIRTELEMIANVGKATGAAIVETVTGKS